MVTMCFGLVACGSGDTDKDLSNDATTDVITEKFHKLICAQ